MSALWYGAYSMRLPERYCHLVFQNRQNPQSPSKMSTGRDGGVATRSAEPTLLL